MIERSTDPARRRVRLVALGLCAVFLAVGVRAAMVTLKPDDGRPGVVRSLQPDMQRADILDRNGELLASSITVYSAFADPRAVWDGDEAARKLATVFPDIDIEDLAQRLSDRSRAFVYIRRGLTPRERQRVFDLRIEGVGFQEERARVYPGGSFAGHVLGFANLDNVGLAGVEFSLDDRLSGSETPVRLTLDSAVQYAVEDELARAAEAYGILGGAGIVLNASNGEVLAMASWPPMDPNRYPQMDEDDPARRNRAVAAVFELGSVYKPLTVAAAFEAGVLYPDDVFDLGEPLVVAGREVVDTHAGPSRASVTDVIADSSNKGTVLIALKLGPRRLRQFFERAGLMKRSDVELAGSEAPILPEVWDELTLSRTSYGHGISVSPLAFASAFSVFANAGERVPPTLVLSSDEPAPERVTAAPTAAAVTVMLRETVTRGTGSRADVAGYRVAGKTGTAEKPIPGGYDPDRNITSFAALFPADDPKFVVLIVLDEAVARPGEGDTAAWNAAPTVGRIIERIAPGLGVVPVFDHPHAEPVRAPRQTRLRETEL